MNYKALMICVSLAATMQDAQAMNQHYQAPVRRIESRLIPITHYAAAQPIIQEYRQYPASNPE